MPVDQTPDGSSGISAIHSIAEPRREVPETACLARHPNGEPLLRFRYGWNGPLGVADLAQERPDENGTYGAMRELATHGATGIYWQDTEQFAKFAVRSQEAGSLWPTVAMGVDEHGSLDGTTPIQAIRRAGPSIYAAGDLLLWERFDIIDRGLAALADPLHPLLDWAMGSELYEIRQGSSLLLWGEEPILGRAASVDGTLAVFSSPDYAARFAQGYHGRMRVQLNEAEDLHADLQLVPVHDLALVGEELPLPGFSIVLNPGAPRVLAGCVIYRDQEPCLLTAGATYRIKPNNQLDFIERSDSWLGVGSLHSSGAGEFALSHLERSFALPIERAHGQPTRSEREEEIETLLSDENAPEPRFRTQLDIRNAYVVCIRNVIGRDCIAFSFSSHEEAAAWLVQHERQVDQLTRAEGESDYWGMGYSGSDDIAAEQRVSAHFRQAIQAVLIEADARGYTPMLSDHLMTLANRTFRSISIAAMGYVGDLAWRMSAVDGQLDSLDPDSWEGFPFHASELEEWRESIQLEPDEQGLQLVRQRLGDLTDRLEVVSKLSLANAMIDRQNRGNSPAMDYAMVSVGVVKALEVEMGALFRLFRDYAVVTPQPAGNDSENDQILTKFLKGGKAPALGSMRHLLKTTDAGLQLEWTDYLDSIEGGRELRTSRFRGFLQKSCDRYRNGGAHDRPIALQTAEACVQDMLGSTATPGWLSKVIQVKVRATELAQAKG